MLSRCRDRERWRQGSKKQRDNSEELTPITGVSSYIRNFSIILIITQRNYMRIDAWLLLYNLISYNYCYCYYSKNMRYGLMIVFKTSTSTYLSNILLSPANTSLSHRLYSIDQPMRRPDKEFSNQVWRVWLQCWLSHQF